MDGLITHTPESLNTLDRLSTVITSEKHGYTARCPELGIEGKGPTAYDAESEMLQAVDDYLYGFDNYDLYQEILLYSCDQFYGWPIFVSPSLPEERVQDFCKASGSTYFDPYASEHEINTKFEGGV